MISARRNFSVSLCLVLLLVLSAFALATSASAVEVNTLKELIDYPQDYVNEPITIDGTVRPAERTVGSSAAFYYLRDETADNIRVRVIGEPPLIGSRISVTGVWTNAGNDADGNPTFFLDERDRSVIGGEPATPESGDPASDATSANAPASNAPASNSPAAVAPGTEPAPSELEDGSSIWIYVIVAGLLFALLIAAVFFVLNRKPKEVEVNEMSKTSRIPVEFDGERTMKVENDKVAFHVPETEMTMGVVPGKLTVVQGDELGEIRLYRTGGDPSWTFGREPGKPLRHFQIKDPTVSRQHATLRYLEKQFKLINHSHTNPVIVNGEAVPVDGSVELKDQSMIMLGDVTLKFFEVKTN